MKQITLIFILVISTLINQVQAQKLTPSQLKVIEGVWVGTLTYLDYTSGKPVTMPANTTFAQSQDNPFIFLRSIGYSTEPHANQKDSMILSKDGKMIDDYRIISSKLLKNGTLHIIGQKKDVDGNESKMATIKRTYLINTTTFINKKEVLFDGENKWIERHQYTFTRSR